MPGNAPDLRDPVAAAELLRRAGDALRADPHRRGCHVRLPARGRLLATGDLHDNPIHFDKVVRCADLDASPDHHVVLHELIHGDRLVNGLDLSHRMLLKVASLVLARPGQVHPLLANHELSQMTGRGVSKGAGDSVQLFNDGLDFVYGDEAGTVADAINAFIAAMPLALLSEPSDDAGGVCCAHSLPNARLMNRFDPGILERDLAEDDYRPPLGAAYLMTWGRRYTPEQVDDLAHRWSARLFCLGHEHVETGAELRGRRVVILNTDHERAAVLPLDLAQLPDAPDALALALPLAIA
ncbi:MAG: metallophosphoesterase [Planctomycetota bacterium]|jgi:hypothetical protein